MPVKINSKLLQYLKCCDFAWVFNEGCEIEKGLLEIHGGYLLVYAINKPLGHYISLMHRF